MDSFEIEPQYLKQQWILNEIRVNSSPFLSVICDNFEGCSLFLLSENLEIKNRKARVLFQGRLVFKTSFIPTTFSEFPTLFINIMQFQMGNSSPCQHKEGTIPRLKKFDLAF
jgi:hypothetical protein